MLKLSERKNLKAHKLNRNQLKKLGITSVGVAVVGTTVIPNIASAEGAESPVVAVSSETVDAENIDYNAAAYAQLEQEIEQGLITDSAEADARYEELNEQYSDAADNVGIGATSVESVDPVNPAAFEQLMVEVEAGLITTDAQAAFRLAELEKQAASTPSVGARSGYNDLYMSAKEVTAMVAAVGPLDAATAGNLSETAASAAANPTLCGFPKSGIHNGKADAFRHSYWHALMTRDIGWEEAKQVGEIHEKYNVGPKIENQMDKYNNDQGIKSYGRGGLGSASSDRAVLKAVQKDINNGKMKYIKNNKLVYTNQ